MARYIDADKLVEKYERAIADNWNKKTSPSSWADAYDCVIADIDDQPTADVVSKKAFEQAKWERDTAIEQLKSYGVGFCEEKELVEVVRCKDCRHATFYSCKNDPCYNLITCEFKIGIGDENFFCSYGERNEGNELL